MSTDNEPQAARRGPVAPGKLRGPYKAPEAVTPQAGQEELLLEFSTATLCLL